MNRIVAAFLIILLVGGSAFAGDTTRVVIPDFSPGLNTVKSDRSMQPNEARVCQNVDLGSNVGALTIRKGYDSLFTIAGQDSFLWNQPMPIQYSDGERELLMVADSDGVGYANIYRSERNSLDFGSRDSIFMWIDSAEVFDVIETYGADASFYAWVQMTSEGTTYKSDTVVCSTSTFATWAAFMDSLAIMIQLSPCSTLVEVDTVHGDDSTLTMLEHSSDVEISYGGYIYFHHTSYGWYPLTGWVYDVDWSAWSAGFVSPDRIATYYPATGTPKYEVFKDKAYIVNSVGRGVVYDGKIANLFPLLASGEVLAIPLTTSGTLNGRYRYCLRNAEDTAFSADDTVITTAFSYLSKPIVVDSGQANLRLFPRRSYSYHYTGGDSITYEIWRTVGTVGTLDKLDSIWNTGYTVTIDSANYLTVVVTDTLSDDTLRTQTGIPIYSEEYFGWETSTGAVVSAVPAAGNYTQYDRPGGVAIYNWDSMATSYGIWGSGDTAVAWQACVGFSTMAVAVDTTQDIPADSSIRFTFFQWRNAASHAADTSMTGYAVGISRQETEQLQYVMPRIADSNVVFFLYRGPVEPISYDSLWRLEYGGPWYADLYSKDFHTPHFYLLGQYNQGDTVTDTLCYDALILRDPYEMNYVPVPTNGIVSFDGILFLTDGSHVSRSTYSDTNTSFFTFNRTPINPDDGDQIVDMWAQKGGVAVGKNRSKYLMYKSGGAYNSSELSAHYGVISPLSHASAPEGDYFLSHDGVRLESEGLYKDRSTIGSLMSNSIKSFTSQSLPVMRQSVGFCYDSKYLLSVPSLDTTYVLHKIPMDNGQYRYSWATWDFTFSGAALYAVSSNNDFIPADTMYFTKPGGSSLYRYGGTDDNGTHISFKWESGPLGPMDGRLWHVNEVALWARSTDTVDYAVECRFYDDSYVSATGTWGLALGAETVRFGALNDRRFHKHEHIAGSLSLYWTARLTSSMIYNSTGETVIDGLEIKLESRGATRSQ